MIDKENLLELTVIICEFLTLPESWYNVPTFTRLQY